MHGAVGYDYPCSMRGNVARHTLELLGNIYELFYVGTAFVHFAEPAAQSVLQRYADVARNGFCHYVHVGIVHAESPAYVAHDGFCRKCTERGYTANVLGTVFFGNVIDNLAAAVVAEVCIKIGHAYSFRV